MKTEEKAKKYDEALEWMRELYPGLHGATKEDAEHYFPELKESEDERIRKELIGLISCMHDADPRKKRWIAWLEKQKEQSFTHHEIDESLQDAVTHQMEDDGDVDDFVRRGIDSIALKYAVIGAEWQQKKQKPEEWSEEDKETIDLTIAVLKENLPNVYFKTNPANTLNMGAISTDQLINRLKSLRPQPKPEWSEEDENKLNHILEIVHIAPGREVSVDEKEELESFLKSLCPQPKAKLTRLDENIIKAAVAFVEQNDHFNCWGGIDKHTVIKALRSLKSHQKSAEWSEEDEEMRKTIIQVLKSFVSQADCESNPSLSCSYPTYRREIDWFKSLSDRFNLQPQAKEEQKPEAKLTGWVARDSKYNSYFGLGLVLFKGKPRRSGECWSGAIAAQLPWELFPDLKWMGEPVEVEITIRKK